jgi:hypothetical protein
LQQTCLDRVSMLRRESSTHGILASPVPRADNFYLKAIFHIFSSSLSVPHYHTMEIFTRSHKLLCSPLGLTIPLAAGNSPLVPLAAPRAGRILMPLYFCSLGRKEGHECIPFVQRHWRPGSYSDSFFVRTAKRLSPKYFEKLAP